MSFTKDLSKLQSDIRAQLPTQDIESVIDVWIDAADSMIRADLRIRPVLTRATAMGGDEQGNASRYLPLPARFLEMKRLKLGLDANPDLTLVAPEALFPHGTGGALPRNYAIHRQIEFDAVIDPTVTVEMVYYEDIPRLGERDKTGEIVTTNWILENHYPIYLYGALSNSGPYERSNTLQAYLDLYHMHVNKVQRADLRSRTNHGFLQITMSPEVSTP